IFSSCIETNDQTSGPVGFNRALSIEGEWEVTHAEVIYSNQKLKKETINDTENLARNYEYRFFEPNKFERGQPETFRPGIEEMHGMYKIDSASNKIRWYLENRNGIAKDTILFDYIEINSNK